jgi:hypothetical protein
MLFSNPNFIWIRHYVKLLKIHLKKKIRVKLTDVTILPTHQQKDFPPAFINFCTVFFTLRSLTWIEQTKHKTEWTDRT